MPFGNKPALKILLLCLAYLAEEGRVRWPEGAQVLAKQSYMDDLMGAAKSCKGVQKIIREVELALKEGAFSIAEWNLNNDVDMSGVEETTMLSLECPGTAKSSLSKFHPCLKTL